MDSPWKPFLKENIIDPYPMYQKLRETDPVHKTRTGEWVITRYEDAKAILKNPKFIVGNRADWLSKAAVQQNDKWESFQLIVDALKSFVVFKNPPDHTVLRKFITLAWSNREVDQIINENINILLGKCDPRQVDIVKDIAIPLPAMTMTRILGLPMADYEYLSDLSHQMIQSLDIYLTFRQIKLMEKASLEFVNYFEDQAVKKIANPDEGLFSRLLAINKDSNALPHHELIANTYFLFIAGEETTAGSIELSLYHLIRNGLLNGSLQNPKALASATDEVLRYDSPTQIIVRMATEDAEISSKRIVAGDPITICLGAANRDPMKFDNPDKLVLDRSPNPHLAFATGIHRCLGDWLAKRELEILLSTLAKRFNDFELLDKPVWKENLNMRSLQSLHASFE